jgi:UDP-glucuronate decarboxylase
MNIGNPNEITIRELAQKIIDLTESKSKIVFLESTQDDPKKRNPNIGRIYNDIGWSPEIDLDTGLLKTIDYFRGIL